MTKLTNAKILILATDGFQKEELFEPMTYFRDHDATVHIASPELSEITADSPDGKSITPDMTLNDVKVGDYNAIILPGGLKNPDTLRTNEKAINLIREFAEAGKTVAAICHAPWLLIEAGLAKGREMTSYPSLRTDLENAGANWMDKSVVCDNAIVTSRKPDDISAFNAKIAEEIREGLHDREHLKRAA